MASIFVIKEKIDKPMEWYSRIMKCNVEWEYDDILELYHAGDVYIVEKEDSVSFEDMSENEFFAWETSSWIDVSDGKELIYGFYNDDGCAEFVHIKDRECIRNYRVYDFEIDTDEGSNPEFDNWIDVARYVDHNLL